MRCKVRIGEKLVTDFGKEKSLTTQIQDENGNIITYEEYKGKLTIKSKYGITFNGLKKADDSDKDNKVDEIILKDTDEIIDLGEHEITNISINSENVGLEHNEIRSKLSGAKEEKKFNVTIKGRIIPSVGIEDRLSVFPTAATGAGLGIMTGALGAGLPKNIGDYEKLVYDIKAKKYKETLKGNVLSSSEEQKNIREMMKKYTTYKNIIGGTALGIGLLKAGTNVWQKISGEQSLEACNRLKEWALCYKKAKESSDGNKEIEFEDYKDVKIEIILSDIQSLYYEFANMYVESYSEDFSIKDGEGVFELVLKQQYSQSVDSINVKEIRKVTFTDKVIKGTKSIMERFFGEFIWKKEKGGIDVKSGKN